tara:strand:- start:160 stop:621 length:462 start_codon:yes stop_codon:yes gene_type:complete
MSKKDLANNLTVTQLLDPATLTATANSNGLDTQFDNGAMIIVNVGESGDTLSSTVKWDYILQDSSDNSTFSAVTDTKRVTYGTVDSSGIFATVDAAAEDDAAYKIGYIGPERYVRVAVTKTGTHTNGTPHGVVGLTSPIHKPDSGGNDGSPTG